MILDGIVDGWKEVKNVTSDVNLKKEHDDVMVSDATTVKTSRVNGSALRALERAVAEFDGKDRSYLAITNFVTSIEAWLSLEGLEDGVTLALVRSKLANTAITTFERAKGGGCFGI
jgi:2-phospho-L-lactate transferase/gluconeogenesis factor (CofD/UPF0052 family)